MNKIMEIERSIIKKYRKEIWSKFIRAIKDFDLIKENDKIAVCISGGKDSFLMAKLFQELKRHGKIKFEIIFLVMNPGYSNKNEKLILKNSKVLNIPLEIFNTEIFNYVNNLNEGSPCYLCARMRRGHLYNKAKELGCNKIALAHHFDDVIETILLSMFYNGEYKTMLPKLKSKNFEGMQLIRPMYFIREEDIISWKNYNKLEFLNCACRFTEICSTNDEGTSKRREMKNLLKKLREINPNIDYNIFKSSDNVNLDAILGYRTNNEKHSYLEEYEKEKRN